MGGAPASADHLAQGVNNDSNDIWDLDCLQFLSPKMVRLMQGHKKADKNRVYSYHGTLAMFDNQAAFDSVFAHPDEIYKVSSQSMNATNVFERDRENADLKKMRESVMFEVFVYEFKNIMWKMILRNSVVVSSSTTSAIHSK